MDRLTKYVPDIKKAHYFDIQNVSNYFWSNQAEYFDLDSMYLAPPFPFFATRYSLPSAISSNEKGETPTPHFEGKEVLTVFRVVKNTPSQILAPDLPTIKWRVVCSMFVLQKRSLVDSHEWFMMLNDRGMLVEMPDGGSGFYYTTTLAMPPRGVVSFLHVSGLALTFLHAKNTEVLPPPPQSKKRLPRKRKFEARYHRLRINALGKHSQASGSQSTGIKKSLHIVRGHFREYGPEFGKGKLFGKYEGRYWVASHFSGSDETGIVDKDYEIDI